MEFMFYVAPGLITALAVLMAVKVVRRSMDLRRAWNSGLTAEARCLRMYTTTRRHRDGAGVSTRLHHVYEFTTREGRSVRFEETGGAGTTIEGDVVVAHYSADRPERATAHAPGTTKTKMVVGTALTLCILAVIVAFCLVFVTGFAGMSASDDPFSGMP
jgi:hypothetical protein